MTVRCGCGKEFKKVTTNRRYLDATDGSEELSLLMAKVRCPDCKKADSERRFRIGDGAVSDEDLVERQSFISTEKYHCLSCSKDSRFYMEKEGDVLNNCPRCGSMEVKHMGSIDHRVIAKSSQNMIKALDATAKMTMDTYGMSNLNMNSNMKPGDSCAPKLAPRLQTQADSFFNGGGLPHANRIGANAMAGAYRDPVNNPVAKLHASKVAPKFNLTQAPPVNVKQGAKISQYDRMLHRPN